MSPKIGLYSVSYAGLWYDGPALSIQAFVDRAKRFGFDGVELDARAPHALPYLLDDRARREIAQYIGDQGLELCAIAANNDFSSPVTEHREANVQMVIDLIALCQEMGAPVLRIFTAWRGSSFLNGRGTYEVARPAYDRAFPETPEMDRWIYCLDCFKTIAPFAEQAGVTLALQNHPPVVRNAADCLAMANEVNSPNFKLSFDISGERAWQDTAHVRNQARLIGDCWVHSHFSGDFRRDETGKAVRYPLGRAMGPREGNMVWNYEAWVQGMFANHYDGYVCYEACTPTYLSNGRLVPVEMIDERVQLAREFMQDLFDANQGMG